jgi:hypothetical protein
MFEKISATKDGRQYHIGDKGEGKFNMKKIIFFILTISVLLFTGVLTASAHGGGFVGGGIWIGPGWGPWWGPPYYSYYYAAPPVVMQQQRPVYEQQAPQVEQYYWYFCQDFNAYYPYVKQCPGGWLKVVPPQRPSKGRE